LVSPPFFNWRGTVGKATAPDGQRLNVKGPILDLDWITWKGRKVIIAFDADAAVKDQVRFARIELAQHLRRQGAVVGFLEWDLARGKGIDDHLAAVGPEASAVTPKAANDGHLKTGQWKAARTKVFIARKGRFRQVFFSGSFSRQAECGKLALPERRIRQRWEAARAPTQGLTESGGESATRFEHLLAGKRKSQGLGTESPWKVSAFPCLKTGERIILAAAGRF